MRHALVVYESMFGNTRVVAEAVAEGLRGAGSVDVVEVGDAPGTVPADVDLLAVGGPTQAFGMSRPSTRKSAADEGGDRAAAARPGIREWLDGLRAPRGLAIATFDTRIDKKWVPGAAAAKAHRRLRRLGLRPVAPPTDFYVTDVKGPLAEGEVERARHWGCAVATH